MNVVRHVLIRGRVQGVGYRAFVQCTALDRGLEGWVRNRRDGSVEAVFAGPAATVAHMLDACRRGPPGARIDVLDERQGSLADLGHRRAGERFSILPTA
jgi:acylphosphatase